MRATFFERLLLPHVVLAAVVAGVCWLPQASRGTLAWAALVTGLELLCWYWTDVLLTDRTPGERMVRETGPYVGSDGLPTTESEVAAWLLLACVFFFTNWASLAAGPTWGAATALILVIDTVLLFIAVEMSDTYTVFCRRVWPRLEKECAEGRRLDDVRAARREAERFYAEHAQLLRDIFPEALLRTYLNASAGDATEPAVAWAVARKLIGRLLPLVAQTKEVRRLDEERCRVKTAPSPGPDPAALARAARDEALKDVIAELRMGLPPEVIADALEQKASGKEKPPARNLTQDDVHKT